MSRTNLIISVMVYLPISIFSSLSLWISFSCSAPPWSSQHSTSGFWCCLACHRIGYGHCLTSGPACSDLSADVLRYGLFRISSFQWHDLSPFSWFQLFGSLQDLYPACSAEVEYVQQGFSRATTCRTILFLHVLLNMDLVFFHVV